MPVVIGAELANDPVARWDFVEGETPGALNNFRGSTAEGGGHKIFVLNGGLVGMKSDPEHVRQTSGRRRGRLG